MGFCVIPAGASECISVGKAAHKYLMDLHKMIAELQAERQRLDEAIVALERLSEGKARRRGRPPGWLKDEIERQSPGSEKSESEPFSKAKKARN